MKRVPKAHHQLPALFSLAGKNHASYLERCCTERLLQNSLTRQEISKWKEYAKKKELLFLLCSLLNYERNLDIEERGSSLIPEYVV